jgi:cell division protein FtsW
VLNRLGVPQLIACAVALVGLGLVMVYSASAVRADLEFGSPTLYVVRQLHGIALGGLAAFAAARVPLEWLRRSALAIWALGLLAIIATFTPLGLEHNGARRWVTVAGVGFQPLEIAKLSVVIALAGWLARHDRELDDWRIGVAVPLGIAGVPAALLLFQPDFGGALILAAFACVMVFVAGARLKHLGLATAMALPLAFGIAVSEAYRVIRLDAFLNPWGDPLGRGYQLVQSLLAFGAGGITGTGLGAGQQKLGYLPEAHTDFILSVVGEELGLLGVAGVLAGFALLGLAALAIASRGRDPFAILIALGASLLLWLQGLVNAGVAMGVLPTKGTTLPLFSYGRSSLAVSLVAIGLILNTARPKRGGSGWR